MKLLAFLSVVTVLFSSCLKDLSNNDEPQNVAGLNVVNASPGSLAINFFLDNNLVNGPSLLYGQESGYVLAVTGTRKFDAATGGTFNSIVTDTIELETDKYYSIFVTGENTELTTFFTEDDLAAPASGKAKIRFINLSPDGGTFTLAIQDGSTLFEGQTYQTASSFKEIDPASYMLQLKNAEGTDVHEASLDVSAGKIYTVWAGGLAEGNEDTALRLMLRANN